MGTDPSVAGRRRAPAPRRIAAVLALVAGLVAALLPSPAFAAADPAVATARIFSDTNAVRASAGQIPLVRNASMDAVAMAWSKKQHDAPGMSHNPSYSSEIPSGWRRAGENVAYGYAYTTVVEAWRNSSGHYANMVGDYTDIGVGYYEGPNGRYFTQVFAKYPTTDTGATAFVLACYTDVLGRTPSRTGSEVTFWRSALASGTPRSAVAGGFTGSDEYRLLMIDAAYSEVLGRAAEPNGRTWWLDAMRAGLVQPDDAHRTFLTTEEFYTVVAGGTPTGFIAALYDDILDRAPDANGVRFWSDVLAADGRTAVVDGIWMADETSRKRVADAYVALLGRTASLSEQTFWAKEVRTAGPTAMRTSIMSSVEYWNRAQQRFATA